MSDERTDYFDLKMLQNMKGFQKLQALWAHEGAKILGQLQKVASKNNESNWRYTAGMMAGFDLAITHLERALMQMEKEIADIQPKEEEKTAEQIIKELRGDSK